MKDKRPQQVDVMLIIYIFLMICAAAPIINAFYYPIFMSDFRMNIAAIVILAAIYILNLFRWRHALLLNRCITVVLVMACLFLILLCAKIPVAFLLLFVSLLITLIHGKCAFAERTESYFKKLKMAKGKDDQ